eukprot:2333825-Alexandrium_andersonii.AAC.1
MEAVRDRQPTCAKLPGPIGPGELARSEETNNVKNARCLFLNGLISGVAPAVEVPCSRNTVSPERPAALVDGFLLLVAFLNLTCPPQRSLQ